jgi:subtilisin family serine protease
MLSVLFLSLWTDENDFCGRTLIVVLEPGFSSFEASLDQTFFGEIEIESIRNISLIHCPGATKIITDNKIAFKSIFLVTLPIDCKLNVIDAVGDINKIKGVAYATPNYVLIPTRSPNDSHWVKPPLEANDLWTLRGLHGINAPQAWNITTGSHRVRVGIIDSGIGWYNQDESGDGIGHIDLNNNLELGVNFDLMSPECSTDTSDFWDHGTKTAGIVGAVGNNNLGTIGINWDISLVPYKVVGFVSLISQGVEAITDAINRWGDPDRRVHILNFSAGGYGMYEGEPIRDSLYNFPEILFVWSAGNDGNNLDDPETHPYLVNGYYDLPNLIAVGAHDRNGDRSVWSPYRSSSFSPSNTHVHLFAPGSDGWTTHRYNNFGTYSGTSMAAPHVTGVVALMISINPNLSASQIKTDLMQHSDAIQISAPGFQSFTVNKLDAFKPVLYTSSDVFIADWSVLTGQTLSLNRCI